MGKGRKPEAQEAEVKSTSHGMEKKEDLSNIPKRYHFFPYYFGFLFTVYLCFSR